MSAFGLAISFTICAAVFVAGSFGHSPSHGVIPFVGMAYFALRLKQVKH